MSMPYREQDERELCQQRVALPVPEIENDGVEISHRRCSRLTGERCARCDLPLCREHCPPPDRRCDRCEAQLERRLRAVLGDAVLLAPRHRRRQMTLVISLLGAAFSVVGLTFAVIPDPPLWILAPSIAVYALAVQAAEPLKRDRAARRLQSRERERFLSESARGR
jgi:hypothetical protein